MVAGGHLIGYTMYSTRSTVPNAYNRGFVNLTKFFFFLGDTQLKIICFLSAVGLFITVGITCYSVSERVLVKRGYLTSLTCDFLTPVFNRGNRLRRYLYWYRYGTQSGLSLFGFELSLPFSSSRG
jgi:hypothetical protein